jgi:hypothetical protein
MALLSVDWPLSVQPSRKVNNMKSTLQGSIRWLGTRAVASVWKVENLAEV